MTDNTTNSIEKKSSVLNIIGIIINIPGIIMAMSICIGAIISLVGIYKDVPYYILSFLIIDYFVALISVFLLIVWGICVCVRKIKYKVSLKKYKLGIIFSIINIGLHFIIALPFIYSYLCSVLT